MDYVRPFEIVEEKSSEGGSIVMNKPLLGPGKKRDKPMVLSTSTKPVPVEKKKPSTKKSKTKTTNVGGVEIISADQSESSRELSMTESNLPYQETYEDTSQLLRNTIGQIDQLSAEVKDEFDKVRGSRTLKRKYDYMPQMAGTISQLLSTKVTAIREINNSISKGHDLELKRMKEVKAIAGDQKDDETALMDMYNAFITMPGQPGVMQPSVPSIMDITSPGNIVRANLGDSAGGYENYQQNMDPTLRAMRYEDNQNVQTVVVFDKSTGARYFEVMDLRTNTPIQGVQKPDPMFLEDTTIDVNNGIARNTNLDQTYPLVVIGQDPNLNKY